MKTRIVAWTLLLCLTASVPAFAIFGLPSAEDLLIWLVLRPIVRRNQDTQVANQIQELRKLVTQLETARNQLTHVRDSTQGLIGAIADPVGDLVAAPTDLLSTTRDWHSDFAGPAGDMIAAITDLGDGTSFSESWRDVLTAADTIAEPDIRAVYRTQPDGGAAALAAYERRRERAARRLELARARADAGADIAMIRLAAGRALGRVVGLVDQDPDTGGPNRSSAALTAGGVLGSLAQIRILTGIGRSRAIEATARAAARYGDEAVRREAEARRVARRVALEADWAADQAALAASRADRLDSMYGGFRLHPVFGGTP